MTLPRSPTSEDVFLFLLVVFQMQKKRIIPNPITARVTDQLMTNARPMHQRKPSNEVAQLKYRKVGRKPGARRTLRRSAEKLIPAYMLRNMIVIRGVIALRLPASVGMLAINHVKATALIGFEDSVLGLKKRR